MCCGLFFDETVQTLTDKKITLKKYKIWKYHTFTQVHTH
jgi:hypothetical protein